MCKEGNVKRAWVYIILHFINYKDVNVIKGFIFVVPHNHWVKMKVSQSNERAISTVSNRDIENVLFTHLLQRLLVVLILISELTWLLRLSSQHRKKKKKLKQRFCSYSEEDAVKRWDSSVFINCCLHILDD